MHLKSARLLLLRWRLRRLDRAMQALLLRIDAAAEQGAEPVWHAGQLRARFTAAGIERAILQRRLSGLCSQADDARPLRFAQRPSKKSQHASTLLTN